MLIGLFAGAAAVALLGGARARLLAEDTPSDALPAPRGVPGDLWADVVIGKRDFAEIAPREVVPYKVSAPGGVVVDRSVSPGRAYVWDSGNSRILGIDLGRCYAGPSPCSADVLIGQPSASDYGACNLDSSFQLYPQRAPASAATLCGVWEGTRTTLEDKSFVNMEVDAQGNLYVPDSRNNRVLKYLNPFTTDTTADEVWGQPDFTGNGCNLTGTYLTPPPPPTASTLCFHSIGASGAGVTVDAAGNLWVADGGNNRVLRFPRNGDGTVARNADLVLGQPDFTTGGDWSYGSAMDRMHAPVALRFDRQGNLYVADWGNKRLLVFRLPFVSGMSATSTLGSGFSTGPLGLEVDPFRNGLWVYDNEGYSGRVQLWGFDGSLMASLPFLGNPGGGSIGVDTAGRVLPSVYVYGQDVYRFTPNPDGTYVRDKNLFSPPGGYNLTSSRRLEHSAFMGVKVVANQLVVSDGRLLFWNDALGLMNGQPADGYLGASSFTELPNPSFDQVKSDLDDRAWVTKRTEVRIYQAPLVTGQEPIKVLRSPLPALGGGQIDFGNVFGLAPTEHGEFLWLSEVGRHRVFRVRAPLSDNPVVDVVLGQTSLSGNQCNRGLVPPPNQNPGRPPSQDAALDMLCFPGALSLDRMGNLYVSDHFLEAEGNWRLLMFASGLFPPTPASVLFAPPATKEFPRATTSAPYSHGTFEPAFDSANRMVVGLNPYLGPRFVQFYEKPTLLNPANPRDPGFAVPDGQLKDFYGWPVAVAFDAADNLFVLDANRGQVRIYEQPFPPPDFTLSCSPSSLNLPQGTSGNSTCTVVSQNGFAAAVDLSCTNLPSGATCAYNPDPVTPPGGGSANSTLSVAASTATTPGTYSFQAQGISGSLTRTFDITLQVTPAAGTAVFDPVLKAPKCASVGSSCDSGTLLTGRDGRGPEPNQPNTIYGSCADGPGGTFHSDESNDRLKVSTVDGTDFAPGKTVKVEATVWAWASNPTLDKLDLYYTANASNPSWTLITTLTPSVGGAQTLQATYTLPRGTLQAVRASFRYLGSAAPCLTGPYDDHDDLIFTVAGDNPTGVAAFDPVLKAPKCASVGSSCDSGTLLTGRDGRGPELNQPNTIYGSCADGTRGTFHYDESNDRIKVSTVDGTPFAFGKTVKVEATVWAWASNPAADKLDLYSAADASSPSWTLITTLTPSVGGAQTLQATYTLPAGSLQAVRARFRYQGSVEPCRTGSYDDHDDLIFTVTPAASRPEFDAASSAVGETADLSWPHTVAGSNRLLLVGASVRGNMPIASVTYGSLPLTKIRHDTFGTDIPLTTRPACRS